MTHSINEKESQLLRELSSLGGKTAGYFGNDLLVMADNIEGNRPVQYDTNTLSTILSLRSKVECAYKELKGLEAVARGLCSALECHVNADGWMITDDRVLRAELVKCKLVMGTLSPEDTRYLLELLDAKNEEPDPADDENN